MFVDFSKNNSLINNIIIEPNYINDDKTEFTRFIIETNDYNYRIDAIGECCSLSFFTQYENYEFSSIIGKNIIAINNYDIPDDYIIDEEKYKDCFSDAVSVHLYEMIFKDTTETFKFLLINLSNGFYDGWIDITEIINEKRIVIIIGLPASGKTTYYNKNLKDNYILYDDFIKDMHSSELINDLKSNNKICLIDPRLCDYKIFIKFTNEIHKYVDKSIIKLILFENNKNKSLKYASERIPYRNVNNFIENYSKLYDIDNYISYNYIII